MSRLIIVSNRLPVTVKAAEGGVSVAPSSGGLATGLEGPHARMGGLWIGWPGPLDGLDAGARREVDRRLAELRCVPVPLSADEIARYYEGYANAVLWPLFHYAVARFPLDVEGFDAYEAVNRRFADATAALHRPGDLVWVHDYQLMLVPAMLRERLPDARIGFFLHIPFPSSELFRLLPQRQALLEGLLGADLLGFHTAAFVRHFASSALRMCGAPTEVDRVRWRGREVRLGVFPMGVDPRRFATDSESIRADVAALRAEDAPILLGVDRLDYTKGIGRRLLAYERLLRRRPDLHGKVRLVQVAVPSRENVDAYRELREEVEALVGRLQGEFATASWSPVRYVYRGVPFEALLALYRAAAAMVVTPLRDGMNLVAKEFAAARVDGDGVLVLSEFAGAASELPDALLVNPYDLDETASALERALAMGEDERRARMAGLRERVLGHGVDGWASAFLKRLGEAPSRAFAPDAPPPSPAAEVDAALRRARGAARLALFLDYDGTLVPFAATPAQAAPDAALLALLRRLAGRPRTAVHVVSGRQREMIDRWLGRLPVGLHAEHGFWSRPPGGSWSMLGAAPPAWRAGVVEILREFAARTPGALVEEKASGAAFHWRAADPEFGAAQAKELSFHLAALLASVPAEVLPGERVLEVRAQGVHKGRVVGDALLAAGPGALALALGDDRTDEDLFAALPPGGIAIHVGPSSSAAPVRLAGVSAARAFLAALADAER